MRWPGRWRPARSPTSSIARPAMRASRRRPSACALDIADHAAVIAFCKAKKIDLVVVGPEVPLVRRHRRRSRSAPASRRSARRKGRRSSKARKASPRIFARRTTSRPPPMSASKRAGPAKDYVRKTRRADRGEGRRACRRQGRCRRARRVQEAEAAIDMMFGGGLGHAGAGKSSSRNSSSARKHRSSRCATVRTRSSSPPRRTTSASATATKARIPAAWAPIRRRRS